MIRQDQVHAVFDNLDGVACLLVREFANQPVEERYGIVAIDEAIDNRFGNHRGLIGNLLDLQCLRDVARAYSFVVEEPIQLIGKSMDDLFSMLSPSLRVIVRPALLRRLRRKVARSVCVSPKDRT